MALPARAAFLSMWVASASAIVVSGCDDTGLTTAHGDARQDGGDTGDRPAPSSSPAPVHGDPTVVEARRHCDGSVIAACTTGHTGPSCTLPCAAPPPNPGGPATAECGFELYCHGDGSVYGLAAINAYLYEGAPEGSASAMRSELVGWITTHEEDLGLAPGLDDDDIGLIPAEGPSQRMGGLTISRFTQTYRGLPVLAPDDLVQVVHNHAGAVQISGRIVDGRIAYEDFEEPRASARHAVEAIRYHAHVQAQVPLADVVVAGEPTLVAMPEARRVAWVGSAKHTGGRVLGRVIVSADAGDASASGTSGAMLPLLSWRVAEVEDLASTSPIQVRTADPASNPVTFDTSVQATLIHGEPLLGSIDDVSGQVQLATDAVVVLDLNGGSVDQLDTVGTRILDPNGEFLAVNGAAFSGQLTHHLLHSWYALIDGYLTDPVGGTKRWDPAGTAYYPHPPSPTPPGTFAPRMLAFINAASSACPTTAVACAGYGAYTLFDEQSMTFPEIMHQPPDPGPNDYEVTGRLTIPTPGENGDSIDTLAHEFGHVVDLFAGPGMTKDIAPDCAGPCALECVADTSDEAPPLGETISQLFGLLLLRDSFEPVDFEYCGIVGLFSRSNVKAFGPGPCVPEGEFLSLFQRPETCLDPEYCDKPAAEGFWLQCCDPAVDTGCIVAAPADCDSGFQRQVPTGLCDDSPGYNTHSVMQAFWQLLNGQRCEPVAPFECEETTAWPPGVTPADAVVPAFLYSLRLNPLSYEQLFDGMGAYIACSYGSDGYDEFNAVMCGHGIRECDASPPMTCEDCGNNIREGGETCDGLDWAYAACTDLPGYVGGDLHCDQDTCELDFSYCLDPGGDALDSTAGTGQGTGAGGAVGTTWEAATETDDGRPRQGGESGCACDTNPQHRAGTWLLMFLAWIGVRRHGSFR
jgi:hypothetical protein